VTANPIPLILILLGTFALISVYTLGPYFWGFCSRGIIRKGNSGGDRAALTFDDGPDPRYTPRCLEILKAHGIHATFFLVGQKVRMYPDLVRQILAHGHDVGNHTWSHQHHWRIGPRQAINEVRKGTSEISQSIGDRPRYFRPSYGVMNLFSYWEARRLGQRCVLWSVIAKDWEGGVGGRSAATIAATVGASLEGGSIVLLHDSGGAEGAPATMLDALPDIISEAQRRGLRLVALREMIERKHTLT
jgi:peptidoglycan/xylan/chitin deacetylase (PgdA/CDA1 family)